MIKTPLSTMIGGAFWTARAAILGGTSKTFNQLIQSLFANSEQGFAYDPNDLSTMYQDAAGTVPVTAAGQPVGLIRDKSGRGNHASQTTSASRPILRQNVTTGAYYLEFDGSDDFLVTNSIDFTVTNKMSLFGGVNKQSDVSVGVVFGLASSPQASAGTFELYTPETNGGQGFVYYSRGSSTRTVGVFGGLKSPVSFVFSAKTDIANNSVVCKANSSTYSGSGSLGTGNFGNYPLYIGRRGGASLPFNGHIYSLIGIGRLTTESETTAIEKELAKRTGVTLSV